MTERTRWLAAPAAAAILALALFGGLSGTRAHAQQAASEVKIDNFNFVPETLTIAAGTTVTWTNHDDIPHTVVSTDGLFKSKARDTNETFSYTFTKAGSYGYYCSLHPRMTGKIVVH